MKLARNIKTLEIKMASDKAQYATPEQATALEHFLKQEQHNVKSLVTPDHGTSVLGNGISILTLEKGKRKPTYNTVFRNPWTQTEQWTALEKMIEVAKHKFPDIAHLIHYEAGNMD